MKALAVVAAQPGAVFAQAAARLWRIGVLSPFIGPDSAFFEALRTRLQELGYVEGKNAAYLYRAAEDYDGLARHAADLVRLQAHVIVTAGRAGRARGDERQQVDADRHRQRRRCGGAGVRREPGAARAAT